MHSAACALFTQLNWWALNGPLLLLWCARPAPPAGPRGTAITPCSLARPQTSVMHLLASKSSPRGCYWKFDAIRSLCDASSFWQVPCAPFQKTARILKTQFYSVYGCKNWRVDNLGMRNVFKYSLGFWKCALELNVYVQKLQRIIFISFTVPLCVIENVINIVKNKQWCKISIYHVSGEIFLWQI